MDYVIEHTHIIDHPKFLEAGIHARDLWEWGMKYAGRHETDGHITMAAVLASPWGYGGKANVKAATRLVEVGLWERTERGFLVLKWTEMGNKTKAQMEGTREKWRSKKKTQRAEERTPSPDSPPPKESPECPGGTPQGTPAGVLNSTSYSLSGSGSREGVQGEAEPGVSTGVHVVRRAEPDIGTPTELPAWFSAALATVEAQTGETLRPPDSWLRYSGHRAGKGIAKNQQDAVYWLTTVMVPEARKERQEAARQRERDAKFDRQRAGPGTTTETLVDTPEEQAERAERLRRQAAERKAARERGAA